MACYLRKDSLGPYGYNAKDIEKLEDILAEGTAKADEKSNNMEDVLIYKDEINKLLLFIGNYYHNSQLNFLTKFVTEYLEDINALDFVPDIGIYNTISKKNRKTFGGDKDSESYFQGKDGLEINKTKAAFFDNAYGTLSDIKNKVTQKVTKMLLDTFVINRTDGTLVTDIHHANANVRRLKLQLFNLAFGEDSGELYEGDEYTGILNNFKNEIAIFNVNLNPEKIEEFYYRDKDRYKALESWFILNNFDNFLDLLLGEYIKVDFLYKNKLSDGDIYHYSNKSDSSITTWRDTEELYLENEINKLSQALINTTPLYKYGTRLETGKYLTFDDFFRTISKIKNLHYSEKAARIVLNNTDNKYTNILNKYPDLEGYDLTYVINNIRDNPLKWLKIALEILNDTSDTMDKLGFTEEEKDKCFSLYKGVFDANELSSIKSILNKYSKFAKLYYQTITQTADSIFETKFVQYYQKEDGSIILRSLRDLDKDNVRRNLESVINRTNSRRGKFDYKESDMKPYNAEPVIENNVLKGIRYNLGKYTVSVYDLGQTITLKKGEEIIDINSVDKNSELYKNILEFIKTQLAIDVVNDAELLDIIYKQGSNPENLLKLASIVYFNKYVSAVKLADVKGPKKTTKELDTIYGSSIMKPSFNYSLNEMNLIPDSALLMLEPIANAQAIVLGIAQSIQVTDSEGNAQSTLSTSRLIGSLPAQLERIKANPDNAASHFQLLTPGFFKGYYNTKDFKSEVGNKDCTKFTVAEFVEGYFLYSFVQGFISDKYNNKIISNNTIGILPCTNSDKNNFGTALFDCSKKAPGIDKSWAELNNGELEQIIRDELGNYYIKMDKRIRDLFKLLSKFSGVNIDYDNNFEEFNALCKLEDIKAYDKLYELTRNYNLENRLHPIAIVEQSFFIKNDARIKRNNTLQASIKRFSDPNMFNQFMKIKHIDMMNNIFTDGVTFNLDEVDTEYTAKKYLKDNYSDWVSPSKSMIVAKVTIKGETYNISNKLDLEILKKRIPNLYDLRHYNFELHPMLVKWNNFDYLLSLEYVLSAVGSHVNHKSGFKAKPKIIFVNNVDTELPSDCSLSEYASTYNQILIIVDPETDLSLSEYLNSENYSNDLFDLLLNEIHEEADRFLAQWKRNVSNTATMYPFQRHQIDGPPTIYNIAPVEDINYNYFTLNGAMGESAPFDGATFVNPYVIEWENNALDGNKAGVDKKPFVHYYDLVTGTGGIIKTAGFGVTNDRARNNKFYRIMLLNMTDYNWLNENGTLHIMKGKGILLDFEGNNINYDPIFFKKGSKFYYREIIDYKGNNTYETILYEVNNDGTIVDSGTQEFITVNNNYELHTKLFGGWNSMDLNPETGELEFSETSRISVAKAANYYAIKKNNVVDTAEDLWQPMKHSDIHYMPNVGAIKLGIASVNPSKVLYEITKLNFYQVEQTQAGIQLDKEHQADNAHISLMTLVMSAAASMGYSTQQALNLYNALNSLTKIGTKDFRDLLGNITTDPNLFDAAVSKIILDSVLHSSISDGDLILNIAKDLILKMKDAKQFKLTKEFAEEVDSEIPYSNRGIYNKIVSILTSTLTKAGIKLEMQGILAVLNPTLDAIKLYKVPQLDIKGKIKTDTDGNILWRKVTYGLLEDYFDLYGVETEEEVLNKIDIETLRNSLSPVDTLVGRYYTLTIEEFTEVESDTEEVMLVPTTRDITVYIKSPNSTLNEDELYPIRTIRGEQIQELGYRDLRSIPNIINITETSRFGQDLQSYNVTFKDIKGDNYSMLDLDLIQDYFDLKSLKGEKVYRESIKLLEKYNRLESFKSFMRSDLAVAFNSTNKNSLFIKILDNPSKAFTLIENDFALSDELKDLLIKYLTISALKILNRELQFTLEGISPNGKIDKVWINGLLVTIDKESIKTLAYGCIMPKTFKSALGLDSDDDLNYIKNNPDFFILKIARNFATKVNNILDFNDDGKIVTRYNFHVELKRNNGKHIYIREGKKNSKFSQLLLIDKYTDEQGKIYWRDSNGDIVCELSSDKDEVWLDYEGNQIIVVPEDTTIWKDSKGNIVSVQSNTDGLFYNGIKLSNDYKYTENGEEKQLTKEDYSGIQFYMNNSDYSSVYINRACTNNEFSRMLNHLVASSNPVGSDIGKKIRDRGKSIVGLAEKVKKLREVSDKLNDYSNLEKSAEDDLTKFKHEILRKLGRRMHTSFLKTLNIIAARIPAQSQQSFMAMEVEGYDNPDINSAYVSSMQFYLQGSDLDIDAVSLQTFTLDHSGLYVGHSPYYKLESEELLKASESLPFPTGVELELNPETSTLASLIGDMAVLENEENLEIENDFISKILGIDARQQIKQAINDSIFRIKFYQDRDSDKITVKVYLSLDTTDKIKRFAEILKLREYGTNTNAEIQTIFNNEFGENKATEELLDSINEQIIEIINRHNLYVNKASVSKRTRIMKNYATLLLYDLIIDPINLREAQSSVDAVTKEAKDIAKKSPKASALTKMSTGNAITKFEGISANMVGKDGIAVCATGLKGFFAMTQAWNQMIKDIPSSERKHLLFSKRIGGKEYKGLANVYDGSKVHPGILELFSNADKYSELDFQDEFENFLIQQYLALDAANEGSACLSLSTDNAKELVLDKINAGTATLGMYLYGLFIGVPFETLYKIIASPAGVRLHDLTKGDYLNGNKGTFDIIGALDYTKTEPYAQLAEFNKIEGYDGNEKLTEILLENNKLIDIINTYVQNGISKEEFFKDFNAKRSGIDKYLVPLEASIRDKVKTKYNQLIDFVLNFAEDVYLTDWGSQTYETVYGTNRVMIDFEELAMGAVEFKAIGKILKMNQGIDTNPQDLLKQVSNIEDLITKQLKQIKRYFKRHGKTEKAGAIITNDPLLYKINLKRFLTDPNSLKSYIEEYNKVKNSFNPLYIFKYSPNYRGYAESLMLAHEGLLLKSAKYSVIYSIKPYIELKYAITDPSLQTQLGTNLENIVDTYFREEWMKLRYAKKMPVIPSTINNSKSYAFTDNLDKARRVNFERPLKLGTVLGDANFKLWMEQIVIPEMLNMYPNNKFILNLVPSINPKSNIGAISSAYNLKNVNMLPRSAYDKEVFREYKKSFNELRTVTKAYKDAGGNEWSPQELLYLYSLIVNNGKISPISVHSIFEDYLSTEVPKSFHKFISILDKSDFEGLKEYIDNNILLAIPFSSPYRGGSNKFRYFNKETETIEIWEKAEEDDTPDIPQDRDPEDKPNIKNGYTPTRVFTTINPNYSLSHLEIFEEVLSVIINNKYKVLLEDLGKGKFGLLDILITNPENADKVSKYIKYLRENEKGLLPTKIVNIEGSNKKDNIVDELRIYDSIESIECHNV